MSQSLVKNLLDALRIHAVATARYAIEGNLGTAIDRGDTFLVIAKAIKSFDSAAADQLLAYRKFFYAAGFYAGGEAKRDANFPLIIERACIALEANEVAGFNMQLPAIVTILQGLDETYNPNDYN